MRFGSKMVPGPKVIRPQAASIKFKKLQFLITDQPLEHRMEAFVKDLQAHGVTELVRVGGDNYPIDRLLEADIDVVDIPFEDGAAPSQSIIDRWFRVLKPHTSVRSSGCVAVHCRSGLGRAPVLVAVALVELGMKYEDAALLIRQQRPGAMNSRQINFLSKYRRKSRLSSKTRSVGCLPI